MLRGGWTQMDDIQRGPGVLSTPTKQSGGRMEQDGRSPRRGRLERRLPRKGSDGDLGTTESARCERRRATG